MKLKGFFNNKLKRLTGLGSEQLYAVIVMHRISGMYISSQWLSDRIALFALWIHSVHSRPIGWSQIYIVDCSSLVELNYRICENLRTHCTYLSLLQSHASLQLHLHNLGCWLMLLCMSLYMTSLILWVSQKIFQLSLESCRLHLVHFAPVLMTLIILN